jgi:hypothetical protein
MPKGWKQNARKKLHDINKILEIIEKLKKKLKKGNLKLEEAAAIYIKIDQYFEAAKRIKREFMDLLDGEILGYGFPFWYDWLKKIDDLIKQAFDKESLGGDGREEIEEAKKEKKRIEEKLIDRIRRSRDMTRSQKEMARGALRRFNESLDTGNPERVKNAKKEFLDSLGGQIGGRYGLTLWGWYYYLSKIDDKLDEAKAEAKRGNWKKVNELIDEIEGEEGNRGGEDGGYFLGKRALESPLKRRTSKGMVGESKPRAGRKKTSGKGKGRTGKRKKKSEY